MLKIIHDIPNNLNFNKMNLLKKLYQISSPSGKETQMMNFIRSYLDKLGIPHFTDKAGNIYATKGLATSYPCIVSHTDEVHRFREKGFKIIQSGTKGNEIIFGFNYLNRSHFGIGADDKNGIWICLKCLEEFATIKCVFFVSEEINCLGSSQAKMKFFNDCRFVVQCDRKGNSDIVTYCYDIELCSNEFLHDAAPEQFGYKKSKGLITDVIKLKQRGLKVSCVNLSCGYYLPHTPHEFTCIDDLMKCYNFVKHIITNCKKTYRHKIVKKPEVRTMHNHWREKTSYNPFYYPFGCDDFSDDINEKSILNLKTLTI